MLERKKISQFKITVARYVYLKSKANIQCSYTMYILGVVFFCFFFLKLAICTNLCKYYVCLLGFFFLL